jgi:hypothetical protein
MSKLDEIITEFDELDYQERLELLLDFSENLPELPERFRAERDAGLGRIPECMTPVFLEQCIAARNRGGAYRYPDPHGTRRQIGNDSLARTDIDHLPNQERSGAAKREENGRELNRGRVTRRPHRRNGA